MKIHLVLGTGARACDVALLQALSGAAGTDGRGNPRLHLRVHALPVPAGLDGDGGGTAGLDLADMRPATWPPGSDAFAPRDSDGPSAAGRSVDRGGSSGRMVPEGLPGAAWRDTHPGTRIFPTLRAAVAHADAR